MEVRMGIRRELLTCAIACACVSTDFTSGLPCARDDQCGGDEKCEFGFCGGAPAAAATVATIGATTTEPESSTDTDDTATASTSSGGCFAPDYGCPSCDPLDQDCPDGTACYARSDMTTECVDLYGEGRATDQCAYPFDETCAPGFVCSPLTALETCPDELAYCCFEVCDLTAPNCEGGTCEALWFGAAPEELAHVGYCAPEGT
jgi:hypothetical protein